MSLPILLSFAAIAVSVITLLLTQFQGPDISLVSTPKFEVARNDEGTKTLLKQFLPPPLLDLEATPFIFANHGGKSGTVVNVDLVFTPQKEFQEFLLTSHCSLSLSTEQLGIPGAGMPTTIMAGDNKVFIASASLYLVDWKRKNLSEILDPETKIQNLIEQAESRSRIIFESFCDFIRNANTLGTISCSMCYTKGRFRTRVKTKLLRNISVDNKPDISNKLREFLRVWDNLQPTSTQLFNEMKADIENITRELNRVILELKVEVTAQNLSQRLNFSFWQQLSMESRPYNEKISWFIIRCESGLEQELKELYNGIDAYNSLLDDVNARGDFKSEKDLLKVNEERMKLRTSAQEVVNKLSEIYHKLIT
jgi:transcription elongation factor Elf1